MYPKLPFVKVPDFRRELLEEHRNHPFYASLSEKDKEAYMSQLITTRSILWAGRTAAAAYNLVLLVGYALLICIIIVLTKNPSIFKFFTP